MAKLNALSAGIVTSVSGSLLMTMGPNGTNLHADPQKRMPTRCYVLEASTVALDALIPYSAITYDLPSTNTTALLGTLSGGVFTFTKEGFYLVSFFVTVEADLGGATTATPDPVTCDAVIQLGTVDFASSRSKASFTKVSNFDGFVTNSGAITQDVDLSGLEVFSDVFEPKDFVTCGAEITSTPDFDYDYDGYITGGTVASELDPLACDKALNDEILEVDDTLKSTVPASTVIDVDTSLTVITGSSPAGTGYGSLSGCALVQVMRNASGVLKILDAGVERSPTVAVYATKIDGDVNALNSTLSILQI